jgi:hypothetical protein
MERLVRCSGTAVTLFGGGRRVSRHTGARAYPCVFLDAQMLGMNAWALLAIVVDRAGAPVD